jgi:oligopeptide transport system permease protein
MVRAILLHALSGQKHALRPPGGEETAHIPGGVSSPAWGTGEDGKGREIMGKYLLKRILHGIFSIVVVVAIVMVLIYSMLQRELIFSSDALYTRQQSNAKQTYMYNKWEEYGYLDYVPYSEWLQELSRNGELDEETRAEATVLGRTPEADSAVTAEYTAKFREYYESRGYEVKRLDAVVKGRKVITGGQQTMFATKDLPLSHRLVEYFTGLLDFDNIHRVAEVEGERGLTFTLYDPLAGGKFSPAIIGNGTLHKYLLYVDGNFPFIHQNMVTIKLGTSYTVNSGVDVFHTMTRSQGSYVKTNMTFPTGLTEDSADDLHTATYMQGSREISTLNMERFTDDYTVVDTVRNGMSKMGYSFVIGILSSIMAYALGLPIGIQMARRKDGLVDKVGTFYIMFIIAVPSLAYIFMFKAMGARIGLPTVFDMESSDKLIFILPIVSLALPSIANLMKWMRRYMIDQMNSDYVKFARASGLSEGEIFSKHIWKNAAIPIIHGIPGSILGALVGAIITERVYVVPGAGNLLTEAINKYDNGVIVGVTLFYAVLTVVSIILGDILMSVVDPRISFSTKDR